MGKFLATQNSFALGEISPEFFARGDKFSAAGLSRLENMDVLASGAITRRRGLLRIVGIPADAILIPFTYRDDAAYLLAMSDGHIRIFKDDALVQDLLSPFVAADIKSVQYAQRFDTMIFTHPNHIPAVLQKNSTGFELRDFAFSVNDDMSINIPFMRFDDSRDIKLTITPSAKGNSYATVTANAPLWNASNVGGRLLFLGKQWIVSDYVSPTVVTAYTNGGYTTPGAPLSDWREAAFSARRGYPRSITFHQDRLVFGGSRDWPCGVWLSKTGSHMNFDVGTGLDDEAIFITLLSDRQQQIATVVSSNNLQILTTVGEWAITAKPLTPSVVDIRQHTSVGSLASAYLPPQQVEGQTVFVAKNGREIRELILDNLAENYSAVDLCALSSHLMKSPQSIAYCDSRNQILVAQADGSCAVLTKNSTLGISAWGAYKTQGSFNSVAVVKDEIYATVRRDTGTFIEKFSDNAATDSDGFGFAHNAESMPVMYSGHNPKKLRLMKLSARVLDTKSLFFRVGDRTVRAPLPNEIQTNQSAGFSGDTEITLLGTTTNTIEPLWRITGSEPLPCTILSVTAEGRYSI